MRRVKKCTLDVGRSEGLNTLEGSQREQEKLPTVLGKASGLSGSGGDLERHTKSGRASVSFQVRCDLLYPLDG